MANEHLVKVIGPSLAEWATVYGGSGARIENVRSLGGHSGVTIGFDLTAGNDLAPCVLKVLPPGVPARNNFDLMRQVPLLKVLQAHQIPAPIPLSWSEDVRLFGSPYLVTTRLPGAPFVDIFVKNEPLSDAYPIFFDAVDRLVDIHAIDTSTLLNHWSQPRPPAAEIDHWIGILNKSTDRGWIASGVALANALRATAPPQTHIGLVHGDYYSNNWLRDGATLTGIVDWEGASLGPSLLDLGWLCMIYDSDSWIVDRGGLNWAPPAETMIKRYAQRSGTDVSRINWYRALAAYRLASLTAYYFELHRTGKRVNSAWNVFANSFTRMVTRALSLLD